jgi:hypothetical protein
VGEEEQAVSFALPTGWEIKRQAKTKLSGCGKSGVHFVDPYGNRHSLKDVKTQFKLETKTSVTLPNTIPSATKDPHDISQRNTLPLDYNDVSDDDSLGSGGGGGSFRLKRKRKANPVETVFVNSRVAAASSGVGRVVGIAAAAAAAAASPAPKQLSREEKGIAVMTAASMYGVEPLKARKALEMCSYNEATVGEFLCK